MTVIPLAAPASAPNRPYELMRLTPSWIRTAGVAWSASASVTRTARAGVRP